MSRLRRYHRRGNIYFITAVTYGRAAILTGNTDLLVNAIEGARRKGPFELIALVILLDHFHWVVEPNSWHISRLLQAVKMSFGASYRKQAKLRAGRVWQHRFWDHIIRDQKDWNRHIDYVHYNPVKHGITTSPFAWQWSSVHEYRCEGFDADDWGCKELTWDEGIFGEAECQERRAPDLRTSDRVPRLSPPEGESETSGENLPVKSEATHRIN